MKEQDRKIFQQKYKTVVQSQALLSDTTTLVGKVARGAGKSTEMFAPRIERVTYEMPRSIQLLVGASYTFILDTIVPAIITYFAQTYKRGIHYDYGRKPPKHFRLPYTEVADWRHTISFAWGTVLQFVSVDRPESSIGKNSAHIYADEVLRIAEAPFLERVLPTLRGDRTIHGKSHYFGGMTLFSSAPNLDNDHDWWLQYQDEMNHELIEEIMYVAYRVMQAKYQLQTTTNKSTQEKLIRFINKWNGRLSEKRRGQTTFIEGSSFSNIVILGNEYIKNQLKGSKSDFERFKLSILNIRPNKVKDMFFGKFSKQHHIFDDGYTYPNIDEYSIDGKFKKTSRYLKYCNHSAPLLMGYDPGHFMSGVIAQHRGKDFRVLKNFWAIHPNQHREFANKINDFFSYHSAKVIYLYYDRAGNQRRYSDNPKGQTDAELLKAYLTEFGWHVNLMNLNQRTIYFWEHYALLNILFGKNDKVKVSICQNECEELISSIYMSPLKRTDGQVELDKTTEKTLPFEDQVYWSPQIATALMYLLFGKFSNQLPNRKYLGSDVSGI